MRITGGQAARRRLKVPKGMGVRPTPDLVKQAVFNRFDAERVSLRTCPRIRGGVLSQHERNRTGD